MASVTIEKGINGLRKIVLRQANGSSAAMYLYGAQVTSWKNEQGEELLFVSKKAKVSPHGPIRGGIPICFPQFADFGNLQQHGFARTSFWTIVDNELAVVPNEIGSRASVELLLNPRETDVMMWPFSFEFRLRLTLSPEGNLLLTSMIWNTSIGEKPFKFTFAYNSYFSVSDIRKIMVKGLENLDYLDNLRSREKFTGNWYPLTIKEKVDNIYHRTPSKIEIKDGKMNRSTEMYKFGMPDAVVWNPGEQLADLGKKEHRKMLCLGAVVANPIELVAPGQAWIGTMILTSVNEGKGGRKGKKERAASTKFKYTWL